MKIAFAVVFVAALCLHVREVTCGTSSLSAPALGSLTGTATTTTTVKPWTQKIKDGLGKFLQGAAIAGAVQQGFQNARSHKHKPSSTASLVPVTKAVH